MKRCPITYDIIGDHEEFSRRGLRLLSPKLMNLHPLDLSAAEQRSAAIKIMEKMSIQGVQPKFSAQLKVNEGCFELVQQKGHYILKPQNEYYPELPENEAITMTLAETIGLEVPIHGLIISKDLSKTYFIKRFDRIGHNKTLPVEDFSQLLGLSRDTKYDSSMEKAISVIEKYCTFPKIESVKFFKLTVFNFLIGNEDMHVKNFSLHTRQYCHNVTRLRPTQHNDCVKNAKEELALPLNGRKNNLRKKNFLEYFALERLGINANTLMGVLNEIASKLPIWKSMIKNSFLSPGMQDAYIPFANETANPSLRSRAVTVAIQFFAELLITTKTGLLRFTRNDGVMRQLRILKCNGYITLLNERAERLDLLSPPA